VGETVYYGRGAGRHPTASAVISDLMDVGRTLAFGLPRRLPPFARHGHYGTLRDISEIEARYYVRLSLRDKPGVLGRLATVLGKHNVSIASVLQKEVKAGKHVPVVILTHRAQERDFEAALKAIDKMAAVGARTIRLRIEDLG